MNMYLVGIVVFFVLIIPPMFSTILNSSISLQDLLECSLIVGLGGAGVVLVFFRRKKEVKI